MFRHHAPGEGQHKNASGEEADEEQCPPAAPPPVPTTHLRRRGACGACGEACGGLRERPAGGAKEERRSHLSDRQPVPRGGSSCCLSHARGRAASQEAREEADAPPPEVDAPPTRLWLDGCSDRPPLGCRSGLPRLLLCCGGTLLCGRDSTQALTSCPLSQYFVAGTMLAHGRTHARARRSPRCERRCSIFRICQRHVPARRRREGHGGQVLPALRLRAALMADCSAPAAAWHRCGTIAPVARARTPAGAGADS